jgi:acetolactate decarboxylase
MPTLTCQISQSLQNALEERSKTTGESISHIVSSSLLQCFGLPQHTLFQVSTSGALVQGIYEKAVSSKFLLSYGDFGLGTFVNLDGEMVVLDGSIYQVRSDGSVSKIVDDTGTPFAVVVHFVADQDQTIESAPTFEDLIRICDQYRDSDNLFYAFRVDGRFEHIHTRAMKATLDGLPLAKAAAVQPEFDFKDIDGTLVGIWLRSFRAPLTSQAITSIFLSEDRTRGGHLLACSGKKTKSARRTAK